MTPARRTGRRSVALRLVAAALLLTAAGVLLWRWLREATQVAHFATVADRLGAFVGVGEVGSPAGRANTYRVTRYNGRVVRVELVNGLGHQVVDDAGDATVEVVYTGDDDRPAERIHRRRAGGVRRRVTLVWRERLLEATVRPGGGGYRMWYDARGHPTRLRFFDARGTPRRDTHGVEGYELITDGRGLIVEKRAVTAAGRPASTRDGVARIVTRRDGAGCIVEQRFLGPDGRPVQTRAGHAGWHARYDPRGNCTERTFLGVDGARVLTTDGVASWRKTYDARGLQTSVAYFGVDGGPATCRQGYARARFEHDARGYRRRVTYYDREGNPAHRRNPTRRH
jgi:hypothetical protein